MIRKVLIIAVAVSVASDAIPPLNIDLKDVMHRSTNQITTPVGGKGGSWFNDCNAEREPITQINVGAGRLVDSIQVYYGGEREIMHGGSGGTLNSCSLAANETIVEVRGRSGRVLDQIEFVTNEERVCGPYGGTGGRDFSKSIPGYHLSCIFGRAGRLIDQIAFVWDRD